MQYRVDNVPVKGAGAFMPGLTLNGVSYGYGLTGIAGFPGTQPVQIDHDMNLSANGHDPKTLQSNNAPDEILPTIYVPGTKYMGPWGPRTAMRTKGIGEGGNPLPEPAGAPSGVPLPAAKPPARLGGSKVIGWPRVVQTWQSVNSGTG